MGETISDSMLMTKILLTLPEGYDHFLSAWESTPEDQRTKENLISRLSIVEMRQNQRDELNKNALMSNSHAQSQGNNYNKKNEKHNKQTKSNYKPGKCHKCGKPGHWARECRTKNIPVTKPEVKGDALISEALASLQQTNQVMDTWFVDSGATEHMTHNKEWFVNYETLKTNVLVRIGDGSFLKGDGVGSINIRAFNGTSWIESHLSKVLYVPKLKYNLFASGAALDKGLKSVSDNSICKFYKGQSVVAMGERTDKLFVMKFEVLTPDKVSERDNMAQTNIAHENSLEIWHQKLAHQNYSKVKEILKLSNIEIRNRDEPFCDACAKGKIHRLPFKSSNSKTYQIRELIHADVCGPFPTKSLKGSRYFLLLKDDFSHYCFIYFITAKSDVTACIKNFLLKADKHCPKGIKTFRSDNGLEFINKNVSEILMKYGVEHQRSVAYCPEQNGSAERQNRTVVEAMRTILQTRNFKQELWAEAANSAVHILNLTGNSTLKDVSPYELWFGRKPKIDDLHIFGEEVYTYIPDIKRKKLNSKGDFGVFVGYGENVKGYRIWHPETNNIKIEIDVQFTGRIYDTKTKENDKNDYQLIYLPGDPGIHEESVELNDHEEDLPLPENNLPEKIMKKLNLKIMKKMNQKIMEKSSQKI